MKKDSAVSIWISGAGSFFIANSVYSHQKYYENVKKLLKYLLKFIIIPSLTVEKKNECHNS